MHWMQLTHGTPWAPWGPRAKPPAREVHLELHPMHLKVLFLTNAQANVLSGSPDGISKMLAAFEVPSPKLLINLLVSPGGIDTCAVRACACLPGSESGRLPWISYMAFTGSLFCRFYLWFPQIYMYFFL